MQYLAYAITQAHQADLQRLVDHPHSRAVHEIRKARAAARKDARRRFYARVVNGVRRHAAAGPEPWRPERPA
jgi:hypothetical protein